MNLKFQVRVQPITGNTVLVMIGDYLPEKDKELISNSLHSKFITTRVINLLENLGRRHGFVVQDEETCESFFYIKKFPKSPEDIGSLAHEVFHLVELVLGTQGAKLNETTSEIYAYNVGNIVEEILKRVEDFEKTKLEKDSTEAPKTDNIKETPSVCYGII